LLVDGVVNVCEGVEEPLVISWEAEARTRSGDLSQLKTFPWDQSFRA
jgi:hypothetical protein